MEITITSGDLLDFDLPHSFAASYTWEMPFDLLFKKDNQATRGWKLSGLTQFSSGVPVMITETDDQSLMGNTGQTFRRVDRRADARIWERRFVLR